MSLPGADELFRATIEHDADAPATHDAPSERASDPRPTPTQETEETVPAGPAAPQSRATEASGRSNGGASTPSSRLTSDPGSESASDPGSASGAPADPDRESAGSTTSSRRPSGRVRHDEKMTVYVTADELLDIEHARLALRRSAGRAVDRGRLVRAAVAMALADFDANGDDSDLVRRLRDA